MLDVARHYFTPDQIKILSTSWQPFELNTFYICIYPMMRHLGLELADYPELTKIGASRGTWFTDWTIVLAAKPLPKPATNYPMRVVFIQVATPRANSRFD